MTEPTVPFDETPDVAGTVARCEDCGTSVGPLTAGSNVSLAARCPCGKVLEVWPS